MSYCESRADIQPFPEPRCSGQCVSFFVELPPSLCSVSLEEVYKCHTQREATPNSRNCQSLYKAGAHFVKCAAEACLKTVWEEALVEDGIQNSQLQRKSQCEFRGFITLQLTNLMQYINLCYLCVSGLVGNERWVHFYSWEDWLVLLSCFCLRREVSSFLFLKYMIRTGKSRILQHHNYNLMAAGRLGSYHMWVSIFEAREANSLEKKSISLPKTLEKTY